MESDFDHRFSHTFHLEEKRFSLAQRNFAKYAFSNLIGGIGFFRGRSIIQRSQSKQPEYSSVKSLFSAVPSRPFFPRGFLWDEGFHQLLVSKWDFEITLEVLKSWFSVMEPDGWIPREQILGEEARSKVPAEFQTQYDIYANPPTLFLPIHSLYQKFRSSPSYSHNLEKLKTFLQGIFPKIETNFKWFQRTQHGVYPNSFRWRGRTENHTLTSGLDDYPRVPKPSTNELHLDLLCWMIKTCKILSELSEFIGENEKSLSYKKIYQDLLSQLDGNNLFFKCVYILFKKNYSQKNCQVVYWDEESKMYADVVLSSSNSLENRTFIQHHGYISLFPLLFGLIPHTSSKLEHIFKILKDPNHLWSPYGIRSLSKSDPYFGTGENYWKGPIWINMNFLLLSSLHANYINTEGPYKEQASQIYSELRSNLITNMFENYERTGFIWEQYNPINGQGQRSHPFTGWSSLIVLIMAELY